MTRREYLAQAFKDVGLELYDNPSSICRAVWCPSCPEVDRFHSGACQRALGLYLDVEMDEEDMEAKNGSV